MVILGGGLFLMIEVPLYLVGYVLGVLRVQGWSGADLGHLRPASARLPSR